MIMKFVPIDKISRFVCILYKDVNLVTFYVFVVISNIIVKLRYSELDKYRFPIERDYGNITRYVVLAAFFLRFRDRTRRITPTELYLARHLLR